VTLHKRRRDIELSHATREMVGRLRCAHDDDSVSFDEYLVMALRFIEHTDALPRAEAMEASWLLFDHATSSLAGRNVRLVAWGW
jgi:hypothetical protein